MRVFFYLIILLTMNWSNAQAKDAVQSGYYLFSRIDSLNEDISWSGIAQQYNGAYLYLDNKNNTLSYFKWGFEMQHVLHLSEDDKSYTITDGHLFGTTVHKQCKDTLWLDNLVLGELNASIPYRSVWVLVNDDEAKLQELQTDQTEALKNSEDYLSELRQQVLKEGFKDYPGSYKLLNKLDRTWEEAILSDAQIKLPLEHLNFRKGAASFYIPHVDKVYMRRVRHLFPLCEGSTGDVNTHQVLIQGNAFSGSKIGIEIFEIQAPKEAINWTNWRTNVVMSPEQILYADEHGLIFLSNDGHELLASYQYYDDKHNVYVVACSGKDSDDIKGINEAYSMMRTLNREKHEGEVVTMQSIIEQSHDEIASTYGETPLIKVDEANITKQAEAFSKLEPLFKRNWQGYESWQLLLGNTGNGNFEWITYYILKSEMNEALNDLSMHDVTDNIDTMFFDDRRLVVAAGENTTRYLFRFAIPRNGMTYVFEKKVQDYSLQLPVELEAAAFFLALQQARWERFIPSLPRDIIQKHVYQYDYAESLPQQGGKLLYKLWNKDSEPVKLALPQSVLNLDKP